MSAFAPPGSSAETKGASAHDVCMCFHQSPLPPITKEDWDAQIHQDMVQCKSFAFGLTQFIATNKHCFLPSGVSTLTEVELFMLYTTLLRTEGVLPPYMVKEGNEDPDKLFFVFFTKMDVTEPGAYALQRRLVRFDKPNAEHSATVLNVAMQSYLHALECGANTGEAAKAAAHAALHAGGEDIWASVVPLF